MCMYCEENEILKSANFCGSAKAQIIGYYLDIYGDEKKFNIFKRIYRPSFKINYCPMCRKEAGRVRAKYIKTMDFMFEKINILNCNNANELAERIKENEIIKIDNYGIIEYINSSYIMFYELEEEEESYNK